MKKRWGRYTPPVDFFFFSRPQAAPFPLWREGVFLYHVNLSPGHTAIQLQPTMVWWRWFLASLRLARPPGT